MANLQLIRQRIGATVNTGKITNAMQMVSAVKLKRFNGLILDSAIYLDEVREQIKLSMNKFTTHKLLSSNDISNLKNNDLIILIGINRGLVGSLSNKIETTFTNKYFELKNQGKEVDVITLKKKTIDFVSKYNINVKNHFTNLFENIDYSEIETLKSLVVNDFSEGIYDNVFVIYPKYISTLNQKVECMKFLPISDNEFGVNKSNNDSILFEPSNAEVLDTLIGNFLESSLQYFLLNAAASEYAARFIAMQQATDNAKEMEGSLKHTYFKERQSIITNQILESTKKVNIKTH